MKTKTLVGIWLGTALTCLPLLNPQLSAAPLGTAFTYQGRLADGANAATGLYDFGFSVWDSVGPAGTQIGATLTLAAVPVTNGTFTTTLDFGDGVFDGNARWLGVSVKTNGAASYSPLSPRQPLTASPYSLFAPSAGAAASATTAGTATTANGVANNAVTAAGIASGQVVKSINTLHDAVTLAAGANATLAPSGQTLTLSTPTDWHIGGNAGTSPGLNFIGTTDNQPLEFWVNNSRALRLEPLGISVNVIGGFSGNAAQGGAQGVAIGGGGSTGFPNTAGGNFSTIAGGFNNQVGGGASYSAISGGVNNQISSNVFYGIIEGGIGNQISGASNSTYAAQSSFIGGGSGNMIEAYGYDSSILGGSANRLQYDVDWAVIVGGSQNIIGTNADYSAIGGGYSNAISKNAEFATIAGGYLNVAGQSYAFAAGNRAKANHLGTFVWADSQSADFISSGANQFLIRAGGNVGINKTNPATALDVNGVVTAMGFSGAGAGLTGIPTTGLADGSVTTAKLADGAVNSAKIADNAVGSADLASDVASLGKVTAGTMSAGGTSISFGVDAYLWDHDIFLRGDTYHGIGWYGSPKYFGSSGPNGPVIYGFNGGGLGTKHSSLGTNLVFSWSNTGATVDPEGRNTNGLTWGLTFGANSGEGIASKRDAGGNQFGLDFYTDYLPRLSIDNAGRVGIGTTSPSDSSLDVHGDIRLDDTQLLLRGGTDRHHGLVYSNTLAGIFFDGPFLYGYNGGALGTVGPDELSLKWDWTGNVWISNNLSVASLDIRGGAIHVSGAGIGTSTPAFIHVATAANASGSDGTAINNSLCNGDPNAILIVTSNLTPSIVRNNHPIGVWYNTSTSKWVIFNQDAVAIPINAAFNVLVIKN